MNWKKIGGFIVLAIVLLLIFTRPTGFADAIQTAIGWLRNGAEAIIEFVSTVFASF